LVYTIERVQRSGYRVQVRKDELRTFNVKRRMAKPLTDGLGSIGSSKLEVERWTLKRVQEKDSGFSRTGSFLWF
jgi:hypothetical protein